MHYTKSCIVDAISRSSKIQMLVFPCIRLRNSTTIKSFKSTYIVDISYQSYSILHIGLRAPYHEIS